jgi:hypothetical protein
MVRLLRPTVGALVDHYVRADGIPRGLLQQAYRSRDGARAHLGRLLPVRSAPRPRRPVETNARLTCSTLLQVRDLQTRYTCRGMGYALCTY